MGGRYDRYLTFLCVLHLGSQLSEPRRDAPAGCSSSVNRPSDRSRVQCSVLSAQLGLLPCWELRHAACSIIDRYGQRVLLEGHALDMLRTIPDDMEIERFCFHVVGVRPPSSPGVSVAEPWLGSSTANSHRAGPSTAQVQHGRRWNLGLLSVRG